MADLREYENKDGYHIRATSKAYELYYRQQGFHPVVNTTEQKSELAKVCFAEMKTTELKKYLTERGIPFGSRAKREKLEALAEAAGNHAMSSEKPEESEKDIEDEPGIAKERDGDDDNGGTEDQSEGR